MKLKIMIIFSLVIFFILACKKDASTYNQKQSYRICDSIALLNGIRPIDSSSYRQILEKLAEAIQLDTNNYIAYTNTAVTYEVVRNYDSAEYFVRKAIFKNPQFIDSYEILMRITMLKNDSEKDETLKFILQSLDSLSRQIPRQKITYADERVRIITIAKGKEEGVKELEKFYNLYPKLKPYKWLEDWISKFDSTTYF